MQLRAGFSLEQLVFDKLVWSHLLHGAQCISMSAALEDFLFGRVCEGNCWRRMARRQHGGRKCCYQQAHEHEMWERSQGLHRPWWCHQRGQAKVGSEWEKQYLCTVKAMLTDVLPPAAKKADTFSQFPLFSLFSKIKEAKHSHLWSAWHGRPGNRELALSHLSSPDSQMWKWISQEVPCFLGCEQATNHGLPLVMERNKNCSSRELHYAKNLVNLGRVTRSVTSPGLVQHAGPLW